MRDDRDLDELIDRALARYGDAEPLAGIEQRVLQRAQSDRRRSALQWTAALAIAAALLIAVVVVPDPRSTAPPRLRFVNVSKSALTLPRVVRTEQVTFALTEYRRPHKAALPKQLVFPVDEPITAEESALVRLASYTTMRFSEPPLTVEPIEVQSVDVAPISVDDSNPKF